VWCRIWPDFRTSFADSPSGPRGPRAERRSCAERNRRRDDLHEVLHPPLTRARRKRGGDQLSPAVLVTVTTLMLLMVLLSTQAPALRVDPRADATSPDRVVVLLLRPSPDRRGEDELRGPLPDVAHR
jgi:hypothetical protein